MDFVSAYIFNIFKILSEEELIFGLLILPIIIMN